jgi:hypothetical protein
MISRVVAVAFALAMVIGVTTGCQPEPQPSPSTPIFATEEEAFAAAEETYRAYVDALNQRRADPASTPDPQVFLTGQALETDIDTQRQLDQADLALRGSTSISSVQRVSAQLDNGSVRLDICLDSTGTRVLNGEGEDVTPSDRDSISLITVDFLWAGEAMVVEESVTKVAGLC